MMDNQACVPSSDDAEHTIQHFLNNLVHTNVLLSISHSDYLTVIGGTEKVIRAEQVLFNKVQISYIHIHPLSNSPTDSKDDHFIGVIIDGIYSGNYSIIQFAIILDILRKQEKIVLLACHIHHLLNSSFTGVDYLLDSIGPLLLRFFIHDYFTICPQFNLIDDNGQFCGGPPPGSDICLRCSWGKGRKSNLDSLIPILEGRCIEFVAPSEIAATIWKKSGPLKNTSLRVIPHLYLIESGKTSYQSRDHEPVIKIAYIGYQHDLKGWGFWSRLVGMLDRTQYEFYHIGAAQTEIPGVIHIPLPLETGQENRVVDAIRDCRIDIAILWSLWPETFSFTLFESIAGDCFIITSERSGNIANVVHDLHIGRIFSSESEVLQFFEDYPMVITILDDFEKTFSLFDLQWNSTLAEETANTRLSSTIQCQSSRNGCGSDHSRKTSEYIFNSIGRLNMALTRKNLQLQEKEDAIKQIEDLLASQEEQIGALHQELNSIHASMVWRFTMMFHHRIAERMFPLGSERREFYERTLQSGRSLMDKIRQP